MIVACLPLLAIGQFISHARTDEFDSWLFAHYGRELLDGRMLYRDLWDNKPPGIFWLNALGLWLGRGSLWGVWALCAGAVCAATALVFTASKRLYGPSAAAIASVLAALYLNIFPYHVGCDRPSTFLVTTELAAFAFYVAALTAQRWRWALLLGAGFAAGLGPCLHQSGLAMAGAAALHLGYLAVRRRARWSPTIGRAALFSLGWCLAAAGCVEAIYRTSDPPWAWNAVVEFNRLYFKAEGGSSFVPRFFAIEEHLKIMGLPLVLALATLVQPLLRWFAGGAPEEDCSPGQQTPAPSVFQAYDPRAPASEGGTLRAFPALPGSSGGVPEGDAIGRRPDGLLFLLWVWAAAAIYLAILGPHQRLQYFGVALPPLVMLCAHGVHLLLRSGRRIEATRPAYHVVVGVLWFGYMMIWPIHAQICEASKAHYFRFGEPPDAGRAALVETIRRHTGPEDAIFVSGYGPQLYWDTKRHSAIRYIGTEKAGQLGALGGPMMDEIAGLLKEAKPKAIVIDVAKPADSVHPRVTAAPGLHAWIQEHYEQPPDHANSNLWVRRSVPAELKGPMGSSDAEEAP